MFDEILAPNTEGEDGSGTDNMTAILVKLFNDDLVPLTGWRAVNKVDNRLFSINYLDRLDVKW